MIDNPRIAGIIKRLSKERKLVDCILCGMKTRSFAMFVPDKDSYINTAPDGKQRVRFYWICEQCAVDKKNFEKVEDILFQRDMAGEWRYL